MELVRKGEVVPATPENLALVGDSIGVHQRPGDVNALGNVKFIFPNPYGVYLHDTPTKSTFRRANRAEPAACGWPMRRRSRRGCSGATRPGPRNG